MRIGIDIRAIGRQRTGDETYTRELVKNLLRIDEKNQYLLLTNTENVAEIQEIKQKLELHKFSQAEIFSISPANKSLWTFWSLPRFLVKNDVDVLHVQYITPQFLPSKIKIVTTIHDVSYIPMAAHIQPADLFFLKTLIPISIKKADKVIAVSNFTKSEICRYYLTDKEKIEVVYNGVDDHFFQVLESEQILIIKKKYNLPSKYLLYVGTLQPRKNIPFLIKCFYQFKQQVSGYEDLKLVLRGNLNAHNTDSKIKDLISNKSIQSDVIFSDFVDEQDLPGIYQGASAFCFASLYEGFGLPLIEAMASKIPVLTNDSSCLREITKDRAYIYPTNNQDKFIEQLKQLLNDTATNNAVINQAYEHAKVFSWNKAAQETLAIYEKVFDCA